MTSARPKTLRQCAGHVARVFPDVLPSGQPSLSVAGAIETARDSTLRIGTSGIRAGPEPCRTSRGDADAGASPLVEDRVELPRVYMAWHSRPCSRTASGDGLAADLLAGARRRGCIERSSRRRIAWTSARIRLTGTESFFSLRHCRSGQSLSDSAAAIDGSCRCWLTRVRLWTRWSGRKLRSSAFSLPPPTVGGLVKVRSTERL